MSAKQISVEASHSRAFGPNGAEGPRLWHSICDEYATGFLWILWVLWVLWVLWILWIIMKKRMRPEQPDIPENFRACIADNARTALSIGPCPTRALEPLCNSDMTRQVIPARCPIFCANPSETRPPSVSTRNKAFDATSSGMPLWHNDSTPTTQPPQRRQFFYGQDIDAAVRNKDEDKLLTWYAMPRRDTPQHPGCHKQVFDLVEPLLLSKIFSGQDFGGGRCPPFVDNDRMQLDKSMRQCWRHLRCRMIDDSGDNTSNHIDKDPTDPELKQVKSRSIAKKDLI